MLITAIGFFSLAAILGMLLISYVLRSKETPKAVAFLHGGLAATGIVLLLIYTFGHAPAPLASLILFIIAALGGFMLIYKDLTHKPVPSWLAVVHGSTAIIGFVFLLVFAFNAPL